MINPLGCDRAGLQDVVVWKVARSSPHRHTMDARRADSRRQLAKLLITGGVLSEQDA